jgi:hypothetical protein
LDEQPVDCLWINGEHRLQIPHGEATAALNAMNQELRQVILAKFNIGTLKSQRAQT